MAVLQEQTGREHFSEESKIEAIRHEVNVQPRFLGGSPAKPSSATFTRSEERESGFPLQS